MRSSFSSLTRFTPYASHWPLGDSDDPWLRSCAVYAVGALGLREFAGELDALANVSDPLLRETVKQAKSRLQGS